MVQIAIIGSGISGLAAAGLVGRRHEVQLFERDKRLGGHSNTVVFNAGGHELALDTGFLVYNERTYPNLVKLLAALEVDSQPSDMSFSVSCRRPDLEYAGPNLRTLLARPTNGMSPAFIRMMADITRFGGLARRLLRERPDPVATVSDLLAGHGLGSHFGRFYLLPMAAAIWSCGTRDAAAFPRDTLLRFFDNHGLLDLKDRPVWRTVAGGSRTYVAAIRRELGASVHTGAGVASVHRHGGDVELRFEDGGSARFDHVVVATHADQALALLSEPTNEEREILGAWRYSTNDTWLHTDNRLMPRRGAAWASWNFMMDDPDDADDRTSVTYWLNRLQALDGDVPYLVSLNPRRQPRPDAVIRRIAYRHPVYSTASVATQADLPRLGGVNHTHFCGAYHRHGFHEDGLWSAIRVADDLGVPF